MSLPICRASGWIEMVRTTILTYRGSVRLPGTLIQGSFPSDGAALFPSEVEAIFVGILALTSEKKRALEANRCVDFFGTGRLRSV